jgi:hypothetical protein
MNCQSLNIKLCPWCYAVGQYNLTPSYISESPKVQCWIDWWEKQLNLHSTNLREYLLVSLKIEGFDSINYTYLKAAVDYFHPTYSTFLEHISLLK